MGLLFLYLFLTLAVSFLCSLLEAVILSVTRSHIALMVKKKRAGGRLLRRLKKNIDKSLAAILTLNTVANTMGAALAGAQVLKLYGSRWVALASAVLTFLILFFSEIIPKTIGAAKWKKLAPFAAFVIQGFIYFTYPFVPLFWVVSRFITPKRVFEHKLSREEMIVVAETGVEDGVLVEKEHRIIKNLLRLSAILVQDVMTPRSLVFALPRHQTVGEAVAGGKSLFFSRIPVYDRDLDDMVGMVLRFRIIEASSNDRTDLTLGQLMLPVHTVPANEPVARILDEFIRRHEHLFVVSGEQGKLAGIITLEDVIETLLGVEIVDEFDSVKDMRQFALEQWEMRKKSRQYQTVALPENEPQAGVQGSKV